MAVIGGLGHSIDVSGGTRQAATNQRRKNEKVVCILSLDRSCGSVPDGCSGCHEECSAEFGYRDHYQEDPQEESKEECDGYDCLEHELDQHQVSRLIPQNLEQGPGPLCYRALFFCGAVAR
jgi:hypothetical protein